MEEQLLEDTYRTNTARAGQPRPDAAAEGERKHGLDRLALTAQPFEF